MMAFKARVVVRFSDVDRAGNVYYPQLIHYFHLAFEDFLSHQLKTPLHSIIEQDNLGFPAVHVECDFSGPLRFGDVAEIEVAIERIGSGSLTLGYLVRAEGRDETCVSGHVTIAAVDMKSFKPVALPDKYRELFSQYQAHSMQSSDQNAALGGDKA